MKQRVGCYFPDQGLNPCPLQWKYRVWTTGPPGKSQHPGYFLNLTSDSHLWHPCCSVNILGTPQLQGLGAHHGLSPTILPGLLPQAASSIRCHLLIETILGCCVENCKPTPQPLWLPLSFIAFPLMLILIQFTSVQLVAQSCLTLCDPMDCSTPGLHACPSPTPGVYSNSCRLSWWSHPTISFSVIPCSPTLQSFPASRSFLRSQFFSWGGQSIEASASASVLPMNIQDWFPLGWTGWISLLSKGLSRVFSNTTVQKHRFFGTQLSLWSNSHIHTWLQKKPQLWLDGPLSGK